MPSQRNHNHAATLEFLSRLEQEHGRAIAPTVAASEQSSPAAAVAASAPVSLEKSTSDFARIAVPPQPPTRKPEPAPWILDRNEFVQHNKGSVFIAVSAIARRVASQEAQVFVRRVRKSGEKKIPVPFDHPLPTLFRYANDFHTSYDLWYYTTAWRLITGDSFLWKVRNGFDVPVELWPLPSQWVWALPSPTEFIGGWFVRGVFGREVTLPVRDVVHLSEPSLDWSAHGRFQGCPSLAATATMVDVENAMLQRLYYGFKNFAPPGLHYTTDQELGYEQLKQVYQDILLMHSRAEQTGAPIVSHSGIKAGEWMGSPREMDYANSLDKSMEYILSVFGVPRAITGLMKDLNRASADAALVAFASNTANPLLVHMSQHLTQSFAGDFDDDLLVELPLIDTTDLELMSKVVKVAYECKAVTPNEVREIMLDLAPFKIGGNLPILPSAETTAPFGNDEKEIAAAEEREEAKLQREIAFETEQARLWDSNNSNDDSNDSGGGGNEDGGGGGGGKQKPANGKGGGNAAMEKSLGADGANDGYDLDAAAPGVAARFFREYAARPNGSSNGNGNGNGRHHGNGRHGNDGGEGHKPIY